MTKRKLSKLVIGKPRTRHAGLENYETRLTKRDTSGRHFSFPAGGLLLAITDALPTKQDYRRIVSYRPDADSPEIERVVRVRH